MSIARLLLKELVAEGATTRKVLERMPEEKFEWTPHEKSMPLGKLASHVAHIPSWVAFTLERDELVAGPDTPGPKPAKNAAELVANFDQEMEAAKASLEIVEDATLKANWKMKMGDRVVIDAPRHEVLRRWVFNHMVHHRAQLGLYLRLNDLPVPAIYGSSADEQDW